MKFIALDVETRATAAVFRRIRVIKHKPFTVQAARVLKSHSDEVK